MRRHHTPRLYVDQTDDGRKYRRNRQHLQVCIALGSDSNNQIVALSVDKQMPFHVQFHPPLSQSKLEVSRQLKKADGRYRLSRANF